MVARFLGLAIVAVGVSADVAAKGTTFVTSTSAYEASRPSGVPGGAETFTFGEPPSASDYFAGGALWGTAGPAGGLAAGTVAGGANGPNTAAGHLNGAFGPGAAEASANIAFTGGAGCLGGQFGGEGYTQCITARDVEATPAAKAPVAFSETFGYPPQNTQFFAGAGAGANAAPIPANGNIGGTAGQKGAAGQATGFLADGQGALSGQIAPTGAKGCGGLGFGSLGYTQCVQGRDVEATPAAKAPVAFSETFGYPPQNTQFFAGAGAGANAAPIPANGNIGGTAGQKGAAGQATGFLADGQGALSGQIAPTGAKGCGGLGFGSFGYTQCVQGRAAAPTPL